MNNYIVKYLCDKGADVDRQNDDRWTALLYAAYYGHEDIVKILFANSASVNITNRSGYTALWYAKKYDQQKIVELLGILHRSTKVVDTFYCHFEE